ncbi:MAG: MgtC/SapB family protein [Deltaproteobacteria bacterium]|nr:MgtC/SapB family protein [Deltaproteobacteria bacterium]
MGDKEGCFMNPLTSQFWIGIGVAVLCGGIVGLERQIRGKAAGIRTNILICLGTSIFVQLGVTFAGPQTDPTRVLGQVAVGIGFLGAGVIIAREGLVKGVTTAAVIWVLAGIGAIVGFGNFAAAIVLAIVTVGILSGIELLEKGVRWLRSGEHEREDEG